MKTGYGGRSSKWDYKKYSIATSERHGRFLSGLGQEFAYTWGLEAFIITKSSSMAEEGNAESWLLGEIVFRYPCENETYGFAFQLIVIGYYLLHSVSKSKD